METSEALEPFCAELAARNRTDEDLATLDRANEAIADPNVRPRSVSAGQPRLACRRRDGQSQRAADRIHDARSRRRSTPAPRTQPSSTPRFAR